MALDSHLVKIGVKGQEVVLSVMDKILKKGNDLSKKKTTVTLAAKTTGKKTSEIAKTSEKTSDKKDKSEKDKSEKEKKNTSKFGKSVDKFGNTTSSLANNMSRLDPASAIHADLSVLNEAKSLATNTN